MLKRKAWDALVDWKGRGAKKALMITGARQIGKTTLVREFAKRHYRCFAELNFLEDRKAVSIFDDSLTADATVASLTAYVRKPLQEHDTLILLDEIQECPAARTAIKFLVEDGRFDYVETGSLLGVKTRQVASYPVGFEEGLRMYPLDFEEFCMANGVQGETLDLLRKHFEEHTPVPAAVHDAMMDLFRTYVVVGGMPDVVQRYVDTHDIAQVVTLQEDLLALYRLDIAKYAEAKERAKIRGIFDAIPSQLDDKNRRFVLADLSKSARQNRYASSFLWLSDAGVALPCYNVTEPVPPLDSNGNHSLFKLFLNDVGLLCAAFMGNIQYDVLQGNLEVNMGSIMEDVVAQELRAHGFDLHYYHSTRLGEVDFVVQSGKTVLPIEVKSGNDWRRHKALNNVLAVDDWHMSDAYVLCKGNLAEADGVTYLPLYMVMFLQPERLPGNFIYAPDLSAITGLG